MSLRLKSLSKTSRLYTTLGRVHSPGDERKPPLFYFVLIQRQKSTEYSHHLSTHLFSMVPSVPPTSSSLHLYTLSSLSFTQTLLVVSEGSPPLEIGPKTSYLSSSDSPVPFFSVRSRLVFVVFGPVSLSDHPCLCRTTHVFFGPHVSCPPLSPLTTDYCPTVIPHRRYGPLRTHPDLVAPRTTGTLLRTPTTTVVP